jgi:hypothetical protein
MITPDPTRDFHERGFEGGERVNGGIPVQIFAGSGGEEEVAVRVETVDGCRVGTGLLGVVPVPSRSSILC